MRSPVWTYAAQGFLAFAFLTLFIAQQGSEARTNNNWSSSNRSAQCSRDAEQYANRRARHNTLFTSATGAAIGAVSGGNRSRRAGRGALIGGGVGLYQSNTRWRTFYNRRYHECINR